MLPVLYPRRLLVSLLRCEPGARPPLPLRLRLGECAGGGARGSAERRGEERRGAERGRLPPSRPGCGQPRGRSPPRAGSAAMEPPAGFACVLLCCALCLPAAAPRRPGHRGRCAPGPAAVRCLRAPRFPLPPPAGAGQPARLKSRLRAPRFAAPLELLRALLPGFQLRAAGEDEDRDGDGYADGGAERRARSCAAAAPARPARGKARSRSSRCGTKRTAARPPAPPLAASAAAAVPEYPGGRRHRCRLLPAVSPSPAGPSPPCRGDFERHAALTGLQSARRVLPLTPERSRHCSAPSERLRPAGKPRRSPGAALRVSRLRCVAGSARSRGRAGSGSCPLLWGATASLNELCTLRACWRTECLYRAVSVCLM